jgi:hypothetical protein
MANPATEIYSTAAKKRGRNPQFTSGKPDYVQIRFIRVGENGRAVTRMPLTDSVTCAGWSNWLAPWRRRSITRSLAARSFKVGAFGFHTI